MVRENKKVEYQRHSEEKNPTDCMFIRADRKIENVLNNLPCVVIRIFIKKGVSMRKMGALRRFIPLGPTTRLYFRSKIEVF